MLEEKLFAALRSAGMPEVPQQFSVVPLAQEIPLQILEEIGAFIRTFNQVTTRQSWQGRVTQSAPEIARLARSEVCFFSAWDFHLPPESPSEWQLIEFNDNGSGLFLAGLINSLFYEVAALAEEPHIQPPATFSVLSELVASMLEEEARRFFREFPQGLFLILDDAESLQRGKFQPELRLMRDLWRSRGWQTAIASPAQISWDGRRLLWSGEKVSVVVNRSTDFFWQAEVFSALRSAYASGSIYVAPNPFTYATRSDKRLLEFFSLGMCDQELGIQPQERMLLSAHVPETHLLREDNLEEIAARKTEFFFKPLGGFAGRGLLVSTQVGRQRLRRLLKQGKNYVAQKRVTRPTVILKGTSGSCSLWADLRVWAAQDEPFLLSGRASRHREVLDLNPPGGWLPTYGVWS